MVDVTSDKASLLFQSWVSGCSTSPRLGGVVVIVAPFCEVVCEFEAGKVGGCVFEVDDDELFVGVLRKE